MTGPQQQVEIRAVASSDRRRALALLHLSSAQIDRMEAAQRRGERDLAGLFAAWRDGAMVGAAWAQVTPSRSVFFWPPQLVPGEPEATAAQLIRTTNRFADVLGVAFAQAIIDPEDRACIARLKAHEYRRLAKLKYMACSLTAVVGRPPRGDLAWTPCRNVAPERLERLVEATYQGTLDCAGWRAPPVAEILAGYRNTGVYRPDWWFLTEQDNQDVGCLLLADHPEQQQCELMYMGVLPDHRGRGLGQLLTHQARMIATEAGRMQLVLAVDEANWPAIAAYRAAGFECWDERLVLIRGRS